MSSGASDRTQSTPSKFAERKGSQDVTSIGKVQACREMFLWAVAETQRHCRNASSTKSRSILREKVRSLQSTPRSIQPTLHQGVGSIVVKLRELGLHCKAV